MAKKGRLKRIQRGHKRTEASSESTGKKHEGGNQGDAERRNNCEEKRTGTTTRVVKDTKETLTRGDKQKQDEKDGQ